MKGIISPANERITLVPIDILFSKTTEEITLKINTLVIGYFFYLETKE